MLGFKLGKSAYFIAAFIFFVAAIFNLIEFNGFGFTASLIIVIAALSAGLYETKKASSKNDDNLKP